VPTASAASATRISSRSSRGSSMRPRTPRVARHTNDSVMLVLTTSFFVPKCELRKKDSAM
jgi:hypothetical protein